MTPARPLSDRLASFAGRLPPVLERDRPARSPAEAAVWAVAPGQRRIVIHAGPPKTGTTSIQRCFRKNRAYLLDKGILYPGVAENHSDAVRALVWAGPGTTEGPGAQLLSELGQPGWHTCLLSGEGLSFFHAADWMALRDVLQPFGVRIGVIYAIRDPVEQTRSMIQQSLKSGYRLEDQYKSPPGVAPRKRLEAILSAFPSDAVRLWDFAEATGARRGLIYDFARRIGLDRWTAWRLSKTMTTRNTGLSQPAVDRLAARNRAMEQRTAPSKDELDSLREIEGPAFQLPEEVAARVRRAAEADLPWLKETFGFVRSGAGGH